MPRIAIIGGGLVGLAHLLLGDQTVQALADGSQALVHRRLGDVDHDDVDARDGAGLRDAVAHGAGADDANGGDVHAVFSNR